MDVVVLQYINGFAGSHEALDVLIYRISDSHLLKGTMAMTMFWAAWFTPSFNAKDRRAGLVVVIVGMLVAMVAARLAAKLLPFRSRPIVSGLDEFATPLGLDDLDIYWTQSASAFPSDHAVMFFAIAAGIFMINRWWGTVALLHATVVVCLPRIYLGLHWPSDILAGALFGTVLAAVLVPFGQRLLLRAASAGWVPRREPWLYAALFFVTAQAAVMFDDLRGLASFMLELSGVQLR